MCFTETGSGNAEYETVRMAMNGEPFTMSLTEPDEIRAVIDAVNQGIDAYLEACYVPARGDRFDGGQRKAGKFVLCHCLDCSVSPESLPVLLRRLCNLDDAAGPDSPLTFSTSWASTIPASS